MNVKTKTGTAGYNNKLLISDGKFGLGKNEKVSALVLEPIISKGAMLCHKLVAQPTHTHELSQKPTITHEDEKIALVLFLTGAFTVSFMFR